MCRFKLIDFENFKSICVKTLESFEVLLDTEEDRASHTEYVQVPNIKQEAENYNETSRMESPETFNDIDIKPKNHEIEFVANTNTSDYEDNVADDDDDVDESANDIVQEKVKRGRGRPLGPGPTKRAAGVKTRKVAMKKKIMKYGEFCQQVLLKVYPKRPRKKEGYSAKLDTFCHICKSEVKPYRRHLIQTHLTRKDSGEYVCEICEKILPNANVSVSHFDEHRIFSPAQKCPACEETFTDMKRFKLHLKNHDNQQAFPCPECECVYNCRNAMNYHLIIVHLNKYVCKHCCMIFELKEDYRKHYLWEKSKGKTKRKSKKVESEESCDEEVEESKQDDNNETSKNDESLEVDNKAGINDTTNDNNSIQTKESYGLTFCTYCNEAILDYTNHLATIHAKIRENGSFECKECLVVVNQKYNFANHFRNYHQQFSVPKQCEHCELIFQYCGEYNRHLITHKQLLGQRQFICDFCDKVYMYKAMLRVHIFNHHTTQRCCSFCGRIFEDISEYRVHMQAERATRRKPVVCDICGFSTDHRRYLRDHVIRLHSSRSATCDECGKVCKTALNLRDHKINVHREKKSLCTICGSKFKNSTVLKYHTERSHSDQLVPCHECGKQMHISDLKRHIFYKHSTIRPFECTHCSMTFKNKSGLQKHLHTHTKTRPFNCLHCSQGYYNRDLLQKHYAQQHGISYSAEEMKQHSQRMPSALEKAMLANDNF